MGNSKRRRPVIPAAVLDYFRREGARGGRKGSARLTAEQRVERARKAARARWGPAPEK